MRANRLLLTAPAMFALTAIVLGLAAATSPSSAQDGLSISGTVWFDANFDGVRQNDEAGWRNGEVVLVTTSGELRAPTDTEGHYSFEGLTPGPYRVRIDVAHVWYLTWPVARHKGPYEIGLALGPESVEGLDFGLSNPVEVEHLPIYEGLAIMDGEFVGEPRIAAFVGNRDCAGPAGIRPPHFHPASFLISIASDEMIPGCAKPGDIVRFAINGRLANEALEWQPRVQAPGWPALDLTVGPPVAWWWLPSASDGTYFEAFIDGNLCGREEAAHPGNPLVVVSRGLKAGCGFERAVVTFAVNGVPVSETAVWREGDQGLLRITLPAESTSADPVAAPESPTPSALQPGVIAPPSVGSAGMR